MSATPFLVKERRGIWIFLDLTLLSGAGVGDAMAAMRTDETTSEERPNFMVNSSDKLDSELEGYWE